jgi:hypothetical protein
MTRPAVAKQIQQILLRMAQQGQLRGRVSDDQLVGLLEQVRFLRPASALPPTPHALSDRVCLASLPIHSQAQAANSGSTGGGGKISVRAPFRRCFAFQSDPLSTTLPSVIQFQRKSRECVQYSIVETRAPCPATERADRLALAPSALLLALCAFALPAPTTTTTSIYDRCLLFVAYPRPQVRTIVL